MATFQFDFVGPERTLYSGQVEAVQLPGAEGEMTVLAGHAPVLSALRVGVIVIAEPGHDGGKRVLVHGGFADIGPTAVTVIAERANPIEEVTPDSIDRDIATAEMQRDATTDFARKDMLNGQIVQLQDAKAALRL